MGSRRLFLFASFLSTLGSLTFAIANLGFLTKAGFGLLQIGLVIFISRVSALLIQLFLGKAIEHANPIRILVHTEVWGSLASLGILAVWQTDPHGYFWLFLIFISIRALLMALQNPLRAKVIRLASVNDEVSDGNGRAGEGRFLIWLNKATHGSTVLAGAMGLLSIKYLDFSYVILFDFLTYLVGGILLYVVQRGMLVSPVLSEARPLKLGLKYYLALNRTVVIQDWLLALAFSGANVMAVRLAYNRPELIPIYITMFGLSVWCAGFLLRTKLEKVSDGVWWALLSGAFAALYGVTLFGYWSAWIVVALMFVYLFYWVLFHRYTVEIQKAAPNHFVAQASALRIAFTTIILSVGEIIPGLLGNQSYTISRDILIRLIVVVLATVWIWSYKVGSASDHSR